MNKNTGSGARRVQLQLIEAQVRTRGGSTPVYDPNHMSTALFKLARGQAFKLMMTFVDETGAHVELTLRNVGTKEEPTWIAYGYEMKGSELSHEVTLPSFEETMSHYFPEVASSSR